MATTNATTAETTGIGNQQTVVVRIKPAKRILAVRVRREWDADADPSYLDQDGWEDRRDQYRRDVFGFVGVWAEAEVVVNGTCQTVRSGGLWGIESDSGANYFGEVGREELDSLRDVLGGLGFSPEEIEDATADVDPAGE